jgi:hypothetical protein
MKLTSKTIAPLVVIVIVGGIALSAALNLWKTTSDKVPARYSSGAFEGEYNPGDIRGSYSFADIAAAFDVTEEELARAFGMSAAGEPGLIKAKDLEATYGEIADGEIGTDSIRYFVALFTGMPYEPEESTLLPAPAISLLKDKVSDVTLAEVQQRTVSLSGLKPTDPSQHVESSGDTFVRGKTTFGELESWGLSKAEIEAAIGMEMGKSGITVRDHVVGAGQEFSGAKAELQALIDSK